MKEKRCCCISKLWLSQHNGDTGNPALHLGSQSIHIDAIKRAATANEKHKKVIMESMQGGLDFLSYIKEKMCDSGGVEFVQCGVSGGALGTELYEYISGYMGDGLNVIMYPNKVRWHYGKVIPEGHPSF